MKKIILLLILFSSLIYAQDYSRLLVNNEIYLGDDIEIRILVGEGNYEVLEKLPNNVELVDNLDNLEVRNQDGLEVNYLNFVGEGVFAYNIKPLSLGDYSLSKTKITNLDTGEIFDIEELEFTVQCSSNGVCEEGESYLTCSEDCSSGSADGICDFISDGVCDPDCLREPDCGNTGLSYLTWIFIIVGALLLIWVLFRIFRK
ncbi:hypothetical protein K8R47_00970 [archaeon]|nr:hypothetical protein [archaeon]